MKLNKLNRAIALAALLSTSVFLSACGSNNSASDSVDVENTEITENTDLIDGEESTAEATPESTLTAYVEQFATIKGSTCTGIANWDTSGEYEMLKMTAELPDGVIGSYMDKENNLIVFAEYVGDSNSVVLSSYGLSDSMEVYPQDEVEYTDVINMTDSMDFEIFAWNITPAGDSEASPITHIAIESRNTACAFADGVSYKLTIYSISPEGFFAEEYSDSLAGSGDEDITSSIRSSFNTYMGSEFYDQNRFEEVFYSGKTIASTESVEKLGAIKFTGYAYKAIASDDYDTFSQYSEGIYDPSMSNLEWGDFIVE